MDKWGRTLEPEKKTVVYYFCKEQGGFAREKE